MFRPSAMSRKARIIAAGVAVAGLLVGAALLTQGRGGSSAPIGSGGTDTERAVATTGLAAPGSEVGTSTIVGKDRTQQSLSASLPPGAVVAPAADGAKLTTITTPPEKTLSMLAKTAATAGSTYNVTVKIYGFGPRLGGIVTVAVLVTDSAPQDKPEKPFQFKDRNVLLRLDPDAAEAIASGGAYSGVITLRPSGDTLIPWLSDVGRAQ